MQVKRLGNLATIQSGQTRRPGNPATRQPGDSATMKPYLAFICRLNDSATRQPGDHAIRADSATRQPRDSATIQLYLAFICRSNDSATRQPDDHVIRSDSATRPYNLFSIYMQVKGLSNPATGDTAYTFIYSLSLLYQPISRPHASKIPSLLPFPV